MEFGVSWVHAVCSQILFKQMKTIKALWYVEEVEYLCLEYCVYLYISCPDYTVCIASGCMREQEKYQSAFCL